MTKLVITKAQRKLIEREAEVDFPRECCGLLIAHDAAMAMDAGQIWLIASMDDSRVGEIQAFVNGPHTGVLLPISIQIK
jgi:hypothetical protein